jgi:hypothetical protein
LLASYHAKPEITMFRHVCSNCQTPIPYSNNSNEMCSDCEIRSNRRHVDRNRRPAVSSRDEVIQRRPAKKEGSSAGLVILMVVALAFLGFCASQGDAKATRGLIKIFAILCVGLVAAFFRMLFGRKNADC